jgi:hypothetical protein
MVLTRRAARASLAAETAKPFRVLDLPPELVAQIFGAVAKENRSMLVVVRQVCRAFKDNSLVAFGTSFFEHLIVMLHPLSLTILLEIASNGQISPFVRRLTISGEYIGGVLKLCECANTPNLRDLQTSMQQSRMDFLILVEVFRKLETLVSVRIDNESYRCNDEVFDAVRCGSIYICDHPPRQDLNSAQRGINRAFKLIFECLEVVGLAGKLDIHIVAAVMTPHPQSGNFFDPTSRTWIDRFAAKVKTVELSNYVSSRWSLDLLQSVPNLQNLETCFSDDLLTLSHPVTGPFVWQNLHRLEVTDMNCHASVLYPFLIAHKDTICELELSGVEYISGSWKETFQVIIEMPKLHCVILSVPHETTRPPPGFDYFQQYSAFEDMDDHNFCLFSEEEIRITLGALLHDFKTTDYRHYNGYNDMTLYRVDMRLSRAVLDGRVVISDGKCHLVQPGGEESAAS